MNSLSLYQKSLAGELSKSEWEALAEMLEKHPYFSLGHYIRAKKKASHEDLFIASTHSPNRSMLRKYVEGNGIPLMVDAESKEDRPMKTDDKQPIRPFAGNDLFSVVDFDALSNAQEPADTLFSMHAGSLIGGIDADLDIRIKIGMLKWLGMVSRIQQQMLKYNISEPIFHKDWKKQAPEAEVVAPPDVVLPGLEQERQAEKAEKVSLLDQFLKAQPEMARLDPSQPIVQDDAAAASVEEEGEVVTETLARLLLMQGNLDEASAMYEKLSLLFPEKSTYFETQIAKIKERK